MDLAPEDLRRYALRRWSAVEGRSRRARAAQPAEQKVLIAIELYEAARRTHPGWPDDACRRADIESHIRVRRLLDRAAHVGAR